MPPFLPVRISSVILSSPPGGRSVVLPSCVFDSLWRLRGTSETEYLIQLADVLLSLHLLSLLCFDSGF
jgi:hypothetical protein